MDALVEFSVEMSKTFFELLWRFFWLTLPMYIWFRLTMIHWPDGDTFVFVAGCTTGAVVVGAASAMFANALYQPKAVKDRLRQIHDLNNELAGLRLKLETLEEEG